MSPQASAAPDLRRYVVTARRAVLLRLVSGVMRGAPLLALTGPSGAGKTTMAAALQEVLVHKSVRVLRIGLGERSGIELSAAIRRLLDQTGPGGDPASFGGLEADAITRLSPAARLVAIVDDAERLRPDALGCLRLLLGKAMGEAPQIVFVGAPSFWQAGGQELPGDPRALITERCELPLLDADETRALAELSAASARLGDGVLEALVRHGGGLIGRTVALLTLASEASAAGPPHRLTAAAVASAAARLDAGEVPADPGNVQPAGREDAAAPLWGVLPDAGAIGAPPPLRARLRPGLAHALATSAFLVILGAAAYWQMSRHGVPMGAQAEPVRVTETAAPAAATPTSDAMAGRASAPGTASAGRAATDVAAAIADAPPDVERAIVVIAAVDPGAVPDAGQAAASPEAAPPAQDVAATEAEALRDGEAADPGKQQIAPQQPAATATALAPPEQDASPMAAVADRSKPSGTDDRAEAPATPDEQVANADPTGRASEAVTPPDVERSLAATDSIQAGQGGDPDPVTATDRAALPDPPTSLGGEPAPAAVADAAAISTNPDSPTPPGGAAPDAPAPTAVADAAPKPASGDQSGHVDSAAGTGRMAANVTAAALPAADLAFLLRRGDAMLDLGDIAAARLFYQRAAASGSARAATSLGRTYDPEFLAAIRATGVTPDRGAAAAWYRQGAAMGDARGDRPTGLAALR